MSSLFVLCEGMGRDVPVPAIRASERQFARVLALVDRELALLEKGLITAFFVAFKVQLFRVSVSFVRSPPGPRAIAEKSE